MEIIEIKNYLEHNEIQNKEILENFLNKDQEHYLRSNLSENKAKNLFLQVGDIAILNYK